MDENFEDYVDTSSFDDTSADIGDTDNFSEPMDVESMMNDIPAEPIDSFDVEPTDGGFEAEIPAAETVDIDGLMYDAANTYTTEDIPYDALDSSDIPSDIDDYETDSGSDIADLMDEAAIESLDESAIDTTDAEDTAENDIETLMNNVEPASDIAGDLSEIETDVPENSNDSDIVDANTDIIGGITDITEDEQSETDGTLTEGIDAQSDSPIDTDLSAYDQLLNYYSSHNYGRLDYAEYSKDPEWQALNNAYLQEFERESVDDGGNETPDISDIRNELVAAGIPENSPELDVILANEQDGIGAIEETAHGPSSLDDSIDGYTNSTPIEPVESIIVDDEVSSESEYLSQHDTEAFDEDFTDTNALQNTSEDIQPDEIQIDTNDVSEETAEAEQDIPQELPEETPAATDLPNEINYDEVFEGLDSYDFDGIDYASDVDRLDNSLENFDSGTWEGLTLDEQKDAMTDLAEYVKDVIGFDNPPQIVYYNNPVNGDYGGYSPESNTLAVNEYMLYDNEEAADTVAHELWHAYQHQRASNPQSTKDYQYQYGFDNYISPEDDFMEYQNQLVEAEARAFAQQFKDRLNMKGRRI